MVVIQLGIPKTKSDHSEEKQSLTFESNLVSFISYYHACHFGFDRRTAMEESDNSRRKAYTVYVGAGGYSRKDPLETVYCKCILTQSTIDNRSCFTIKLPIIMFAFGEGQHSVENFTRKI